MNDTTRVCPLCGGTGRRRIRIPGTPRRSTVLVNCTCAAVKKVNP